MTELKMKGKLDSCPETKWVDVHKTECICKHSCYTQAIMVGQLDWPGVTGSLLCCLV